MSVDRVKHLEMIQAIVTRMAGNSFLIKGWTVTVAAALVALAAKESEARFALVSLLPVLSFWGLDAYFLRYERLFRCLYDHVRSAPEEELLGNPYSLSVKPYIGACPNWFRTLLSAHILMLHGAMILAIIAVIVLVTFTRQATGSTLLL